MPGSPKKRAKREAAERERNLAAGSSGVERVVDKDQVSGSSPEPLPASLISAVPVVQGEILAPVDTAEPTRTALKRAMRARAQEHAEKAIAVLVKALESPKEESALKAANDLLAWGFGKPATEIEAGDGAQMIVIRRFGEDS